MRKSSIICPLFGLLSCKIGLGFGFQPNAHHLNKSLMKGVLTSKPNSPTHITSRIFHKSNTECQTRRENILYLSNSSGENQSESSTYADNLSDAFSQITSYRASSVLYLVTSILLLASPNRISSLNFNNGAATATAGTTLLSQPGKYTAQKIGGAAGFAIASAISHLLYQRQNANGGVEENLDSDESSRSIRKLNFGLGAFSLIGLFAVPGEASFHFTFKGAARTFSLMLLSKVVGLTAAFRGWKESNGINGILLSWEEMRRGLRQTWVERGEGWKGGKRTIYSTVFALGLFGMFSNALSYRHTIKSTSNLLFHKSLYISAISRLSLISSVAFVLKDAAALKIIHQPLYRNLKYMLCAWVCSVGVASGFIDEKFISFVLQKTVYFLAFAWPIMFKGRPKEVEPEPSPDIDPEGNDE